MFTAPAIIRGIGAQLVEVRPIRLRNLEAFQGPAEKLAPLLFLGEFQAALVSDQASVRALILASCDVTADQLDEASIAETCALLEAVAEANGDFFDRLVAQIVGLPKKLGLLAETSSDWPGSSSALAGPGSDTPQAST